jgi:uncharacterized CHY-type Zn-finger protein
VTGEACPAVQATVAVPADAAGRNPHAGRRASLLAEVPALSDVHVRGATVDEQTRCRHWDAEDDVVAFRFACCGDWYPCRACHDEATEHPAETWGPGEVDEHAVFCGACRTTMAIATYVAGGHACPFCAHPFNPGCRDHWDRYFEVPASG